MITATKTIFAADLFCGAGGTSCGLKKAAQELKMRLNLVAVNHWPVAIQTHSSNHPYAEHICSSLDGVDPRKAVPAGHLDLLIASPECTHHSVARGGRPKNDQSRASGWHILRWAELLKVDSILIENVPEYKSWGPIGSDGKPLKSRRGETYTAFINALVSLGYKVEDRILNACDHGDATSRERLFIQARRGRRPIIWPEPTHSETGEDELLGQMKKWRAAKEIIDWTIPAQDIFERKRPLAPKTMKRIIAGLKKFGGAPFIAMLYGTGESRSINKPLPTITAGGNHTALCEPFIIGVGGPEHHANPRSVEKPLKTVLTRNHFAICQPFILGQQSCSAPRSTDNPLPTIATRGAISLVEPFIAGYYGSGDNVRSVQKPLPTITTKERFALIMPQKTKSKLSIRFRMLQPPELARAMGFESYSFSGSKSEITKQIGNAVPVNTAKALCICLIQ